LQSVVQNLTASWIYSRGARQKTMQRCDSMAAICKPDLL